MEDSALLLRKKCDNGERIDEHAAFAMLSSSVLVDKLLAKPKQRPDTFVGVRAYEWRLIEFSEIPYVYKLDRVREWLDLLLEKTAIPDGFSLTGNRENILSCHNAMLTTIFLKMGEGGNEQKKYKKMIDAGIRWIIDYQSIKRGEKSEWTGKDLFERFGGCMKKTPCFYGVVKSMIALTEYKKRFGSDKTIEEKLSKGLEYILSHSVYKKLSADRPIEPSIIENFFPYTYKSNIIEILSLLKSNDLIHDPRCSDSIGLLKKKQLSDGTWQADTSYMKSAWVDFDPLKKTGAWITHIISGLLNY